MKRQPQQPFLERVLFELPVSNIEENLRLPLQPGRQNRDHPALLHNEMPVRPVRRNHNGHRSLDKHASQTFSSRISGAAADTPPPSAVGNTHAVVSFRMPHIIERPNFARRMLPDRSNHRAFQFDSDHPFAPATRTNRKRGFEGPTRNAARKDVIDSEHALLLVAPGDRFAGNLDLLFDSKKRMIQYSLTPASA